MPTSSYYADQMYEANDFWQKLNGNMIYDHDSKVRVAYGVGGITYGGGS